jgi:glycosyltransferase involved in cell wall biosynthesis
MKILIIQDFLRCGGTERQTVSMCEYLHQSGHDVYLLTFRPGGRLRDRVVDAGVRLNSLQPFDIGLNMIAPGIFREVERSRPDIILCMGQVANSFAGFLKKRFEWAVVVATARSGRRISWLSRWSFRRADAVLANCDWWRERLISMGLSDTKIAVVPNGLVIKTNQSDRASLRCDVRAEMNAGPATVVYLNVAMFRTRKRHDWLIETFSRMGEHQDWQLWLVGDGKEWSRCRRIVGRSRAARHIRLLGYHDDPRPYYAGADVAVSASVNDALPNFLIEAQSMGLPVIASHFRSVGDAFLDGESGFLVPAADRAAFLAHIERLYYNKSAREAMGRSGALMARGRFSSAQRAQEMVDILKGLADTRLPVG